MQTQPVTINVTEEHIKRGKPVAVQGCMIALAVQEAVPICTGINVCNRVHFRNLEGASVSTPLPFLAVVRRVEFDLEREVKPFSFTLDVPVEFLPVEPIRCLSPRVPEKAGNSVLAGGEK